MTRKCEICRKPFEAKRPQARFCGDTCRKRNQRGAGPTPKMPSKPAATAAVPVEAAGVGLISSVVNELTEAGRLNTALGQSALKIAVRMETSTTDTGAGLAAMSRELRAVLAQALADTEVEADPIDELRARRDRKRSAG